MGHHKVFAATIGLEIQGRRIDSRHHGFTPIAQFWIPLSRAGQRLLGEPYRHIRSPTNKAFHLCLLFLLWRGERAAGHDHGVMDFSHPGHAGGALQRGASEMGRIGASGGINQIECPPAHQPSPHNIGAEPPGPGTFDPPKQLFDEHERQQRQRKYQHHETIQPWPVQVLTQNMA